MTDIPIANAWDTHFEDLYVQGEHGLELDQFSDEQFLVLKENGTISIITGCAHRGISNIVRAAKSAFDLSVRLVLGGFHLSKSSDDMADRLNQELSTFDIEKLGCCHCTGVEKYARMKSFFGERAFYNYTGTDYKSTDYAGADYKGPASLR
jgi:7,8-dihydropterin-6-yl-methyl-4-(beta-D-ribofuranosyl)aminobenzene 5'-phosphate synthase